jgi:peroxiredoxin Q/BCP
VSPVRAAILVATFAIGLSGSSVGAAGVAVGQTAPDFAMRGSDGRTYRLSELLGEGGVRGVVLAWFPKAFTAG